MYGDYAKGIEDKPPIVGSTVSSFVGLVCDRFLEMGYAQYPMKYRVDPVNGPITAREMGDAIAHRFAKLLSGRMPRVDIHYDVVHTHNAQTAYHYYVNVLKDVMPDAFQNTRECPGADVRWIHVTASSLPGPQILVNLGWACSLPPTAQCILGVQPEPWQLEAAAGAFHPRLGAGSRLGCLHDPEMFRHVADVNPVPDADFWNGRWQRKWEKRR